MTRLGAFAPLAALVLAGCGSADDDEPVPGTASVSEKRALEDAAEMIPPSEDSGPSAKASDEH